jgi:hypothetical protein
MFDAAGLIAGTRLDEFSRIGCVEIVPIIGGECAWI